MNKEIASRTTPLRVAWRGLFLQAAFNPERRQGLGFAAAMASVLVPGNRDERVRRDRLVQHLDGFNTNPALAGPLLGAVARLEEEGCAGDRRSRELAMRLKRGMEGPLAARGDALLWAGMRPVAALVGGVAGILGGAVWGAVLFLGIYNAVHLGVRVGGVFWGYARGEDTRLLLRSPWLDRGARFARWALLGTALALGPLVFGCFPGAGPPLLGLLATAAGVLWGRRGFAHGTLLAWGGIIIGLIFALGFGRPVL